MGTTGAIWYHRGPLELKGAGVQIDGGPESLGALAVEQRLRLEKLMKDHRLSRSEALNLLWGETIGDHLEPTIWDAEWNYMITEEGLKVSWSDENIKAFSLRELKEVHENNRVKELLSSVAEESRDRSRQ